MVINNLDPVTFFYNTVIVFFRDIFRAMNWWGIFLIFFIIPAIFSASLSSSNNFNDFCKYSSAFPGLSQSRYTIPILLSLVAFPLISANYPFFDKNQNNGK